MIDFVTLVFNHNIEIELLKLQAISFKYVEPEFIGNIFIFYNDSGYDKIEFIKEYYPKILLSKINIIYRDNISHKHKSSWRTQQYFKLYISNYIESKYYIVLDGKNHFIRKTVITDFISNGKPKLFLNGSGNMIKYYKNCLSYFGIEDPFNYKYNDDGSRVIGSDYMKTLSTITPYIFIKEQVINLINYIENKEKITFFDFFVKDKSISEFYLYSTYLIFSDNIKEHELVSFNYFIITIFNNPNVEWNKYKNKKQAITNPNVKMFGLHRLAVERMDDNYKKDLLTLYSNFFDEEICSMIKSFINI